MLCHEIPRRTPSDTLAETVVTIGGARPSLGSAYSITFNRTLSWSQPGQMPTNSEYDFLSVLLHETEHALGLDHLNNSASNVMYYSMGKGVTHQTLQNDDIECIRRLY